MADDPELAGLHELLIKNAIAEVLTSYCRACDRQDIELMRRAFHEGAQVSQGYYVGSASGFCDRFAQLGDPATSPMSRIQHRISNLTCRIDGAGADVESYFQVCRRRRLPEGGAVDELIAARALDRFEERHGRWGITQRQIIWDWTSSWPASSSFWETDQGEYLVGRRDDSDPSCQVFAKLRRPG